MKAPCPECGQESVVSDATTPAVIVCRRCDRKFPLEGPVPMRNRGHGSDRVSGRYTTDAEGWCEELQAWIYKSPSGNVFTVPWVDDDPK